MSYLKERNYKFIRPGLDYKVCSILAVNIIWYHPFKGDTGGRRGVAFHGYSFRHGKFFSIFVFLEYSVKTNLGY